LPKEQLAKRFVPLLGVKLRGELKIKLSIKIGNRTQKEF
jgi:hypothetical protein